MIAFVFLMSVLFFVLNFIKLASPLPRKDEFSRIPMVVDFLDKCSLSFTQLSRSFSHFVLLISISWELEWGIQRSLLSGLIENPPNLTKSLHKLNFL